MLSIRPLAWKDPDKTSLIVAWMLSLMVSLVFMENFCSGCNGFYWSLRAPFRAWPENCLRHIHPYMECMDKIARARL